MVAARTCGRRVCAWCQLELGPAPQLPVGAVTHGICTDCARAMMPPAPLPTAADLPAAPLALREVVPHPAGGYTLAIPIDASRSTARSYIGRYFSREHAVAALALHPLA